MSKAGIGNGKCSEFQNQSRLSSGSRRCSSKSAQYGYISSQPSQPAGVATSNGLGKSGISPAAPPSRARSCAPRASIVTIGFTPRPVGSTAPSTT